jgi:hypothetical protein
MTSIVLRTHLGWAVATDGFDDGEARVKDLELARHLEFERPRKIRDLIARLSASGDLPGVFSRPTVGRGLNAGKSATTVTVDEYWLTRAQAIFVAARAETKKATEILNAVIEVFLAATRERDTSRQAKALLAEWFPNAPGKSKPIFSDLIAALLEMRGEERKGNPPWAPFLAQLVYEWAFPAEGQQARRRELNGSRTSHRTDHSMFSKGARDRVTNVAFVGIALARNSVTWNTWRSSMDTAFFNTPKQLTMLLPPPRLPASKRVTRGVSTESKPHE